MTAGTSATPRPLSTSDSTVCTCVASCVTRGRKPARWQASMAVACRPAASSRE
ncbi:Uncharacterised protein [Bordetella pertussis]|nr:Uncharacterised protein [Bordetella pertussis]